MLANIHAGKVRFVGHGLERDAVGVRIEHDILYGLQLGHVMPGFNGQMQALIVGRSTFSYVGCNGARNRPLTGIVRCKGQIP